MQKRFLLPKSGFTLIEILIAMAILSMILSMVYTILVSTLSARQLVQNQTYLDRTADKLLNLIIHDLQAAYLYQLDSVCFVGKSQNHGDSIDFVTNVDNLLGNEEVKSDFCEVGYYLKNNGQNTYRLIRREDFFVDDNLLEGGYHIKLYDRVASFQLRYIDSRGNEKKTWNSKENIGLPKAVIVRLGLLFDSQNEEESPEVREYSTCIPIWVSSILPKAKSQK